MSNKLVKPKSSNFCIQWPKFFKIIMAVGFSFFLFITILSATAHTENTSYGVTLFLAIIDAFYLLGICYFIVSKTEINGNKILHRNMFGQAKEYRFSEISKATAFNDDIKLYIDKRKVLQVSTLQENGPEFLEMLHSYGINVEYTKRIKTNKDTFKDTIVVRKSKGYVAIDIVAAIILCVFTTFALYQKVFEGALFFFITSFVAIGQVVYDIRHTIFIEKDVVTEHRLFAKRSWRLSDISNVKESEDGLVIFYTKNKHKFKINTFADINGDIAVLRLMPHAHKD